MRTIAIAASIALITGGGVAGIVVGGAGADIARGYATDMYASQPNSGTSVMRRPVQVAEAVPEDPIASELRPGHDTPPTPASAPARVAAEGLTTDMDAVFPETHTAPATARSTIPAVTPRRPARLALRPAERVQTAPTPTTSRPVPLRAQQPAPVRVVNRTPPPQTTQPVTTMTRPQPQPTTAAPVQPRATTASRQPARNTRTARPPARAAVIPETAPPPVMTAPGPASTGTTADPTHRTTMSQGEAASAPAPASAAPLPVAPAPSPPPAETPSALLANP